MRRSDREVTHPDKIRNIIDSCYCCRLGFQDHGNVYIVPLSFGYEEREGNRIFYFHGASEGRKIDLIKEGNVVGFEMDTHYALCPSQDACGHSAKFQSVIGTGKVMFVEDQTEKIHALNCILFHTAGKGDWTFSPDACHKTAVFKLEVMELSCKEHQ